MRLHVPSFLFGLGVGAGGATLAPRLRPLALEIAATFYRAADAALVQISRRREDLADLLAEAKALARARGRREMATA